MITPKDEELIDAILTNKPYDDILVPVINQVSPLATERGTMPYVNFGEKLDTGFSQFTKLKSVGDKLRYRILGTPYVEGKHFEQTKDGKWDITMCPRINEKSECEKCKKYFEIIMKAKKTGDDKLIAQAKNDARKYNAAVAYYFPVIDRETGKFTLFQSTTSVKNQIEEKMQMGVKIFDTDFITIRTETNGLTKYPTDKVDSSDNPPLTEEELEEVKKYKATDISTMVNGTPEEGDLAVEANIEVEPDITDKFHGGKK